MHLIGVHALGGKETSDQQRKPFQTLHLDSLFGIKKDGLSYLGGTGGELQEARLVLLAEVADDVPEPLHHGGRAREARVLRVLLQVLDCEKYQRRSKSAMISFSVAFLK